MLGSGSEFTVSEQVCRQCCEEPVTNSVLGNQVIQSLVHSACEQQLSERLRLDSESAVHLERVLQRTESIIVSENLSQVKYRGEWACDVLVPLPPQFSSGLQEAIESIRTILDQSSALVFVHLIGDRNVADSIANQLGNPRQVFVHGAGPNTTLGRRLHDALFHLKTEFVAVHDIHCRADIDRIQRSCNSLWISGADMRLARFTHSKSQVGAAKEDFLDKPTETAVRAVRSIVCRRCLLIELGGLCDSDNALVDFVHRAIENENLVLFDTETPDQECLDACDLRKIQDNEVTTCFDHFDVNDEWQQQQPIGFARERVACDIVLPFFNHQDYVNQALEAAVDQNNADVTVHLIDDASTEDTSALLKRWSGHADVRCYRNQENIGQFMSLNNAIEFCDTGLVAVQDADDISMPDRIETGGNFLRLCNADFFGGAVELFGDDEVIRPVHVETDDLEKIQRAEVRHSFFPPASSIPYFLENPTAIFRREMFCQLGGYADFGSRELNRASLDSEFLLRCFFSGVRFAITRQPVTLYRVHQESATQNRVTGWGTDTRAQASQIVYDHTLRFRRGRFDPRAFGSLGKHRGVTQRIN